MQLVECVRVSTGTGFAAINFFPQTIENILVETFGTLKMFLARAVQTVLLCPGTKAFAKGFQRSRFPRFGSGLGQSIVDCFFLLGGEWKLLLRFLFQGHQLFVQMINGRPGRSFLVHALLRHVDEFGLDFFRPFARQRIGLERRIAITQRFWHFAGNHDSEHHSKRKHLTFLVVRRIFRVVIRQIKRRPRHGLFEARHFAIFENLGDSAINQNRPVQRFRKDDIFWLDIVMINLVVHAVVQVIQPRGNAHGGRHANVPGQRLAIFLG
mmetsp:Transcript_3031/g.6423  ORF Transcript_3031/g.6423 Transcript_3031/m.6423 type:complete len:267 (-) Transcript_3031:134-934(-)